MNLFEQFQAKFKGLFSRDDEIDYHERARLEEQAREEMKAAWGPQFERLRELAENTDRRSNIVNDPSLSRFDKLKAVREIFPTTTEEQFDGLLADAERRRDEKRFLSDPKVSRETKAEKLRTSNPDATEDQIDYWINGASEG